MTKLYSDDKKPALIKRQSRLNTWLNNLLPGMLNEYPSQPDITFNEFKSGTLTTSLCPRTNGRGNSEIFCESGLNTAKVLMK